MEDSENKTEHVFTCRSPLNRVIGDGRRVFIVKTKADDCDFSSTVDNIVSIFGKYTTSDSYIPSEGGEIYLPSVDRIVLLTQEQKEQLITLIEMAGGRDVSFTTED